MSSLVTTPPLGSKENPHPITPSTNKERTIGHYYIYEGEIRKQVKAKDRKHGRLAPSSKKTKERNLNRKEYYKKWVEDNKERQKKYKNEWYENNKTHRKLYNQKHSERDKKQRIKWYSENKDSINEKRRNNKKEKETRNKRRRIRYKEDINYMLKETLSSSMCKALKKDNASKNERTMIYTCCTVSFCKAYLESQFTEGMTWENHGFGDDKWNIEHRRCKKSFNFHNEEEIYMCFHWTNLQPMWQPENFDKADTFDPKTFRYKWIDREIGWVGIPKYLMNK